MSPAQICGGVGGRGPRNSRPRKVQQDKPGEPRQVLKDGKSWKDSSRGRTGKCWGKCTFRKVGEPKVVTRPAPRVMNYEAAAKLQDGGCRCGAKTPTQELDTHPSSRTTPQSMLLRNFAVWWMPERWCGRDRIRKARGQKVNSDEDIVRSLRTQNRHPSEGLDWENQPGIPETGT
ncbi:hypothetical protein EVAR_61135_1 [Eumeta japonica]|uniref:Uncharacterized protein n=1 Tax=Eumeta variegata TaxID=151549 RepID=A0A4C2AE06_EUMVA|nr:hypothetical protein EVAR_61135_1 [Eumeta japonica]